MINDFAEYEWHDAEIKGIYINREAERVDDIVSMQIRWPEGSADQINFIHCYHAEFSLNFGVMGAESIRFARIVFDDDNIKIIRKNWERLGVEMQELKCFEIETNSTNSLIRIYAMSVEFERI